MGISLRYTVCEEGAESAGVGGFFPTLEGARQEEQRV